jgi:sulfoxide reductase heme-binding subunit YedZ
VPVSWLTGHYARLVPKRATLMRWVKLGLCVWSIVPTLDLLWVLSRLNPHFIRAYDYRVLRVALATTGLWAFVFLLATLTCTPLQRLARWRWPVELRRTLGLFAFFYCVLHFLAYFVVGQKFRFDFAWADAMFRKSRWPGWASLLLLVPLAATSSAAMVRRLGPRRWKALHRLVYLATALAIAHVAWTDAEQRRGFTRTNDVLIPFAILMLARLLPLFSSRRKVRKLAVPET